MISLTFSFKPKPKIIIKSIRNMEDVHQEHHSVVAEDKLLPPDNAPNAEAEHLTDTQQNADPFNIVDGICRICDKQDSGAILGCSHFFCFNCLSKYIRDTGRLQPHCPCPGCGFVLPKQLIDMCLSEEEYVMLCQKDCELRRAEEVTVDHKQYYMAVVDGSTCGCCGRRGSPVVRMAVCLHFSFSFFFFFFFFFLLSSSSFLYMIFLSF